VEQSNQSLRKLDIMSNRAESMRLLMKTDPTQIDATIIAYNEYMAVEQDAAKKAKAEKDLAQVMFDSSSDVAGFERALAAYKKILEANPEDVDGFCVLDRHSFALRAPEQQ
jgi:hypothetical protein